MTKHQRFGGIGSRNRDAQTGDGAKSATASILYIPGSISQKEERIVSGDEKTASESSVIGYEPELATLFSAIERAGTGTPDHIAIVAESMSGRSTLVAKIRHHYGDRVYYLPLEFGVQESDLPDSANLPYDIILIDNCQVLATRKIRCFAVRDLFLRS